MSAPCFHISHTDLPSDNLYAYALSKTLTKVCSPLTVGLYSSCPNRINMILKNIEVYMEQEAKRREKQYKTKRKPRTIKASISDILILIFRLIFYKPVWTKENQNQPNVRYVFVRFSAWHFAGSDFLWAGLVLRLCQELQAKFGKLQLGLYRVVQHDEDKAEQKKVTEDSIKDWRPKKICCFPLWLLCTVVLTVVLVLILFLVLFGFPQTSKEEGGSTQQNTGSVGAFEAVAIGILGVPAVGAIRFIFLIVKNLIVSQDFNIRRKMDGKKMSEQLGFMNEVRKEMRLLSCFIHFMEVFERRSIKVVLEITNLDRCEPKKAVGVLDSINILLSDEESPFISLLAVNPEVIVKQVDKANSCFIKKDKAFSFLNRIVTLPFTIPTLSTTSKCKLFRNIVQGQSEFLENLSHPGPSKCAVCFYPETDCAQHIQTCRADTTPLIHNQEAETQHHNAFTLNEEEIERLTDTAFESIFLHSRSSLHLYIAGDSMSMRRVINSIRVSVVVMEALNTELPKPDNIAAWVILADRWPCRLSWILQCMEDDQQKAEIDTGVTNSNVYDSKSLWDVFIQHRLELHIMKREVESLLEQDGDPELFEMFLKRDFPFTVEDAVRFRLSTVNLDSSIRTKLAKIRGSTALKEPPWKSTLKCLPRRIVINMSTEDICNEMSRIGLPHNYTQTVRVNHLNGHALLFSDPTELKEIMQMTLGEWTTFKIHFLAVTPYAGPNNNDWPLRCNSDHIN
uniref:KAP NTPase domain-containing protein n=1 Tax=Denticeps clupeoides TaxID=299321 RepID=A0AAY4DBZ7_9TELE